MRVLFGNGCNLTVVHQSQYRDPRLCNSSIAMWNYWQRTST